MVCCQCNRSGRCKNCQCVKQGRCCSDCLPGRQGSCHNSGCSVPTSASTPAPAPAPAPPVSPGRAMDSDSPWPVPIANISPMSVTSPVIPLIENQSTTPQAASTSALTGSSLSSSNTNVRRPNSPALPSLDSVFRLRVSTLHHVPKVARDAWGHVFGEAVQAIVLDPSKEEVWVKFFMLAWPTRPGGVGVIGGTLKSAFRHGSLSGGQGNLCICGRVL